MNTGYGMPSRRRLRGPLHPRNRPPPSSFDDCPATYPLHGNTQDSSSTRMPPPSTTPSGKKREFTATIARNGLGSLPWEQMGPSSSRPSSSTNELPRAEFSFQSSVGFPTSTSTASIASMDSMPSSSSAGSFASFRQQQTPMSSSPSTFRTAADADESSYSARSTIFSRGNQTASAALRETSQAMYDAPAEDQPRKRRRGLAGTIVDTALNAALYTGAAALTAYSLWSSWGQSADNEQQRHHPDAGPQADMGHVVSQNKRLGANDSGNDVRMPPRGLDEPPPPYYEHHGTPSKSQPPQPSTPQSNSVRTRKVFVSSHRNRRRPTFQASKAHRQSTPRKGLPEAFRSSAPIALSSSHDMSSFTDAHTTSQIESTRNISEDDADEEQDENDEMLSRFEAKMNALIAEGQAALNSTPVLQESDLRDLDSPSPSLGVGMSSSRSQHVAPRAPSRFESPLRTSSPFSQYRQSDEMLSIPSSGLPRSASHPEELSSVLPEPVKRTFASPGHQGIKHSRSAFDFSFNPASQLGHAYHTLPFVFGGPTDSAAEGSAAAASPSVRETGRRVTDFGLATRSSNSGAAIAATGSSSSPYSRIPRSTSTLQSSKSVVKPRP
ncbi:uncharacterized protein MEPE_01828 [Melanopsichium pennsylvanicum]|uniref:Uncharacterized protein n=2 Tax=Melanopsichium pennsylvanicum TaxID=63383 RepID=A0AAJ4XIQ1_9BASI|nr:hypothetical protein BN887_04161 [Melanopsichium pennsylvanicum 4]SNX83122.1 uncharacterized protein MEPE_01828 [Melanopsichium pennsylvanicum]